MDWVERIHTSPALLALAERVRPGVHLTLRGAAGSSTTVLAGLLHRRLALPVLLVVAHLDEAADAAEELQDLSVPVRVLPALEAAPGDSAGGLETALARLRASDPADPCVTVAPIAALMQSVAAPKRRGRLRLEMKPGERRSPSALAEWLAGAGYRRVEAIENPGDFAVRGGVVDCFPPAGQPPVRLDHFGDELESVHEIDVATQASDRRLEGVELPCADGARFAPQDGDPLPGTLLAADALVVWAELSEIMEQARGY